MTRAHVLDSIRRLHAVLTAAGAEIAMTDRFDALVALNGLTASLHRGPVLALPWRPSPPTDGKWRAANDDLFTERP